MCRRTLHIITLVVPSHRFRWVMCAIGSIKSHLRTTTPAAIIILVHAIVRQNLVMPTNFMILVHPRSTPYAQSCPNALNKIKSPFVLDPIPAAQKDKQ
jgi:hypothetical protein